MSISLHPGTNASRHAGSFLHRVGRLLKIATYYVVSCGDHTFVTDQRKAQALTGNTPARDRTGSEDNRETGELPDTNEVDITSSHGAITSLFAGASPEAGDFNGKV